MMQYKYMGVIQNSGSAPNDQQIRTMWQTLTNTFFSGGKASNEFPALLIYPVVTSFCVSHNSSWDLPASRSPAGTREDVNEIFAGSSRAPTCWLRQAISAFTPS